MPCAGSEILAVKLLASLVARLIAAAPTIEQRLHDADARPGPAAAALLRATAAAVAGAVLYLSFPPRPLWWLAPVAFAVLMAVLHGRRPRAGLGYGYLFGLGFFLPLLYWIGVFVDAAPLLVLAAVEAVFPALVGAGVAVVSRLPASPLWAACLWAAGEAARARVPFGGFSWGRVAFGQRNGVYLPLVSLGGTALLSFAVALSGFRLGRLIIELARGHRRRLTGAALAALLPLAAAVATQPLLDTSRAGQSVTVAAVQGNVPRLGLDFNAQRRAVLDYHVRAHRPASRRRDRRAGAAPGSGDLAGEFLRHRPVVQPRRQRRDQPGGQRPRRRCSSAVLAPDQGGPRNAALRWEPGRGPVDRYLKRRLQPFGETMPLRGLLRLRRRLGPPGLRPRRRPEAAGHGPGPGRGRDPRPRWCNSSRCGPPPPWPAASAHCPSGC
ncbi:MAG TPA: hypothetical protein VJ757_15705 [Pseudonocardiaceae bacterium]|nr:hypothetical protein [Pseudonocardiaceae bacterium]